VINNNLSKINIFKKKGSKRVLYKKYAKILSIIKKEIKDRKKTLNVLDNKFKFNFKTSDLKKFKKFKKIAIIGMGGSILGAEAIHNFLQHKIKKKVYFFNDLNEKKIEALKGKNLSKILFIIISKSGNTTETLSNVFSLKILKKNAKNIILISEKFNLLHSMSKKLNLFHIEHNNNIGGRFSVLSDVGLIPAYLMGINIIKLRSNILKNLSKKNETKLKNNTIILSFLMNSEKKNNLIFLNYSPELEKFLYWCQQLIAESLGKKKRGFLPVISNAPKDHHSLLQLYLDGPKDKIFYIFSLEKKSKEKIHLNQNLGIKSCLNKKGINEIKNAQKNALLKTLIKKDITYREFKIKNNSEESLGELFSLFILETVFIGKILQINPFDQPAVEQVKIYTKRLLN
jgi:glucose-6-phosphate isomerase